MDKFYKWLMVREKGDESFWKSNLLLVDEFLIVCGTLVGLFWDLFVSRAGAGVLGLLIGGVFAICLNMWAASYAWEYYKIKN